MSRHDIAAAMLTRHVMTDVNEALTFKSSSLCTEAATALAECDFDNAPVLDDANNVIGHVNQHEAGQCVADTVQACLCPMTAASVVGADTPLSELLQRLQANAFLHVIGPRGVVGLVTPSDFNKQAGRAYFYLLVSDLEIRLADCLRERWHDQDALVERLPVKRQKRLRGMFKRQQNADVAADVIAAMYFEDLLILAESTGLVHGLDALFDRSDRPLRSELNLLRLDVMHLVKTMAVDQRSSVQRLGELDTQLRRLLDEVEAAVIPAGVDSIG